MTFVFSMYTVVRPLHFTGEVDKSETAYFKFIFCVPKIIQIGSFLAELFKKSWGGGVF